MSKYIKLYSVLSTDVKPTTDVPIGSELIEKDTGSKYEWTGQSWQSTSINGAASVVDLGIPGQKHDRYLSGITATWPDDDSFSVSFTQLENVRRYRVLIIGGADGDYVKVTEDAVNEVQAAAWLEDATTSETADVEYRRVFTSTPDLNGTFIPNWSEWVELSKDANDLSLSRLDFLASVAGPFEVIVEAE